MSIETFTNSDWLALGAITIGLAGFIFGVYTHLVNRRLPVLLYEVVQLADYGVPGSFIAELGGSLLVVEVSNGGKKQATDVHFSLEVEPAITSVSSTGQSADIQHQGNKVSFSIEKLNPSQNIKLNLYCSSANEADIIKMIECSHADGEGIDTKSKAFTSLSFKFMGVRFTYNLLTRSISLG